MKRKSLGLCSMLLVVTLLIGAVSVSASKTQQATPDIKQFEVNYDSIEVVDNEISPHAVPAFMAGALAGGLIYDVAKAGATALYNAQNKYGQTAGNIDYQEMANQQGPWSVNDYSGEFGR